LVPGKVFLLKGCSDPHRTVSWRPWEGKAGESLVKLSDYWPLSFRFLLSPFFAESTRRRALKQSFKLPSNPLKNPGAADKCEPYLREKRDENARLTRALTDAEAELNDRVYRLFDLSADEIKLLQKEVEH
jgi:hypothetical protein